MTRISVNGLGLNVEVTGDGQPLLALHGFTGSSRTWARFSGSWPGFRLIAPDLIGHGSSDCPPDADGYGMQRAARDLERLLDDLGLPSAVVMGYSMGGRMALQLALAAPSRVDALIVESASPGIASVEERQVRMETDHLLARQIEEHGMNWFVDRWEAQPLFASQQRLPTQIRSELRRQRLGNSPRGLANSLRGMGAGSCEPLGGRLPELTMPVLLIAGELDEKYRCLARTMADALAKPTVKVVPRAGHAVHLERPDIFAGLVRGFLDEASGATSSRERRVHDC